MPDQTERDFHLSRREQCEKMARQASSEPARLAHQALAHEHAKRARAEGGAAR